MIILKTGLHKDNKLRYIPFNHVRVCYMYIVRVISIDQMLKTKIIECMLYFT